MIIRTSSGIYLTSIQITDHAPSRGRVWLLNQVTLASVSIVSDPLVSLRRLSAAVLPWGWRHDHVLDIIVYRQVYSWLGHLDLLVGAHEG